MSNERNINKEILAEEKNILKEERKIYKEVKKEEAMLSRFSRRLRKLTKKSNLIFILIAVIFIGIFVNYFWSLSQPGELDSFAICLGEKDVKFYGAFWCPHCQNQKKLFGNSAKLLPYIECSTADQRGQLQICIDNKIESYPTWTFSDGSKETGEVSLQKLSEKSGCDLSTREVPDLNNFNASSTPMPVK